MQVWKISPWFKGNEWETFLKRDIMYVGDFQTNLTDLSRYLAKADLVKAGANPVAADQLWKFGDDMDEDDIVIAYSDKCIFGVGRIIGDHRYEPVYDPSTNHYECCNIRSVAWIGMDPPMDVSSDVRLFGYPPHKYGVLNRERTIKKLDPSDWNYLLNKYPEVKNACDKLRKMIEP